MDILNNPFFDKINIVKQSDVKYITIYEENIQKNYQAILIRDNYGNNENSTLRTTVVINLFHLLLRPKNYLNKG